MLRTALPLILCGGGVVLLLLAMALFRRSRGHSLLAAGTLLATLVAALRVPVLPQVNLGLLLTWDPLARFGLVLAAAAGLAGLALGGRPGAGERDREGDEFPLLVVVAVFGAGAMVCARHLGGFFLGLETLGAALFALVGFPLSLRSLEAAVKYLVLASVAAAFFLFGAALIFAQQGSLLLDRLLPAGGTIPPLTTAGLTLVLAGVAFKLALVPFHLWVADVYQGAPLPATALVATLSKGAAGVFLVRLVAVTPPAGGRGLTSALALLAVLSMLGGNLLALRQRNLKRLLAYSSIAQLGYLVVALTTPGPRGVTAALLTLIVYTVAVFGALAVLHRLDPGEAAEADLESVRGLYWRRPVLGAVFTLFLLSLAGVPLTAGFIGKWAILTAGFTRWPLLLVLLAGSVIGFYYYLRVVRVMAAEPRAAGEGEPPLPARASPGSGPALVLAALLLLWLGILPGVWWHWLARIAVALLPGGPGGLPAAGIMD